MRPHRQLPRCRSYRAAAELAGCDHHTVRRCVLLCESGQPPVAREHRTRPIEDYLDKIEELVARSDGRVRADVVHERIAAMGFTGGERTTGRTVAETKDRLRAGGDWVRGSGVCSGPG